MPHTIKGFYRIGDYSRFMGVSADLLKHYERCGLIHAKTAENGYRYYPFYESTRLLDCMRLRNYGFTLNEMHTLLCDLPYDDVQAEMDRKIDALEKQIYFQQLVISDHKKTSSWMEMMRGKQIHTAIVTEEPMLFLPQSQSQAFICDKRISELLDTWVSAMPLVKSCRLFQDIYADHPTEHALWGLVVTQSDAKALALPINDAVIRIEGGQKRQLNLHHTLAHHPDTKSYLPEVLDMLKNSDPPIEKTALQIVLMTLNCSDISHESCCRFSAPLIVE